MAERQQVFRWVRDLLAAGLVALTVTTLTVSVIQDVDTISGANEGGSGECTVDLCASEADQVILNADSVALCTEGGEDPAKLYCSDVEACVVEGEQRLCAEQSRIYLGAADDGADIDIAADADITATAGNNLHVSAIDITMTPSSAFAVTAIDEVAIQSSGGGYIGTTTDGVQLVAAGNGDDITLSTLAGGDDIALSSGDALTLSAPSGRVDIDADAASGAVEITAAGNVFRLDATGIAGDVNGVGDDIIFTATDLVTLATDTGGQVQTVPGGVNIIAASVGDGVAIEAADAVTIDAGSILATIESGGTAYRIAGQQVAVFPYFTPSGTSYELAWQWSMPANTLATVGAGYELTGWFQVSQNTNEKLIKITAASPTCNCDSPTLHQIMTCTSASCAAGQFTARLMAVTGAQQRANHVQVCQVASATTQTIVGDIEAATTGGLTPANAYQFCLCVQGTTTGSDIGLISGDLRWL